MTITTLATQSKPAQLSVLAGEATLDNLGVLIENQYQEFTRLTKHTLDYARSIGNFLIMAKEQVPHGEWTAWLETRTSFKLRRAQKFSQLARDWDEIEANTPSTAHLTLDTALELLARIRTDGGKVEEGEDDFSSAAEPTTDTIALKDHPIMRALNTINDCNQTPEQLGEEIDQLLSDSADMPTREEVAARFLIAAERLAKMGELIA